MFENDKIPYFLSMLFAILAWTILQLSNQSTLSPIVEYSKKHIQTENGYKHLYNITNISSSTMFADIIFIIRPKEHSNAECVDSDIFATPPMDITIFNKILKKYSAKSPVCAGTVSRYFVPELQPGSSVQLEFVSEKDGGTDLYVKSSSPIRLLKVSLLTIIIKKITLLLSILIVIWILLIFIYINKIYVKK